MGSAFRSRSQMRHSGDGRGGPRTERRTCRGCADLDVAFRRLPTGTIDRNELISATIISLENDRARVR